MNRGGAPIDFINLLERVSEPLGFGVRGGRGARYYYYYEDQKMMDMMVPNEAMRKTLVMIKDEIIKKGGVVMKPVPRMPAKMPDLEVISRLCPKNVNFSYFLPTHKTAFTLLRQIFLDQSNTETLYQMACVCRDNDMVNCQLFVFTLCSCLAARSDTKHIRIPSHYEILPENYCGADVVRQAHKMAHMPEMPTGVAPVEENHVVMIDHKFTGKATDPEQRMWYFREDILVNSHHFHWHVVFPTCSPKDPKAVGYRDRRGELFYYMHHSMIARYDAERLCNGLPRTKMFNFGNLTLEEGYFGKLTSENSNARWGTRQAFTRLTDIQRSHPDGLQIRVEELERWRDRIRETIDLGYYVQKDPKTRKDTRVPLGEFNGIDVLGDIVESSASLTPHSQYYGAIGFHNMGHVLIAFSHDPTARHSEGTGVMGDVSSAMRDPAFYRWHKYIDNLFDIYKQTLPPYPLTSDNKNAFPLIWNAVKIEPGSFQVRARDSSTPNELKTFWSMKTINLAVGLDFRRDVTSGMNKTPVMAKVTHLTHTAFDYNLKVRNMSNRQIQATFRIFMAPHRDENQEDLSQRFTEQRLYFFEMDKVAKRLEPGLNNIIISSKDSSVTLRDENASSFRNLQKLYIEAKSSQDVVNESQCSCGWPQHLLLPKGTTGGMEYDLFVIVTDGNQDMVNVDHAKGCNSAFSFCGVLGKKYPDARPMGYPFDRTPFSKVNPAQMNIQDGCHYETEIPVNTLEEYVNAIPNSARVKVTIFHEDMMGNTDMASMEEQVTTPDGRCVRMKDLYSMRNSKSNRGRGNENQQQQGQFGGFKGPSRLSPEQQQERDGYNGYNQNQWDNGQNGGRRGRESEEDWEHLGGAYYES